MVIEAEEDQVGQHRDVACSLRPQDLVVSCRADSNADTAEVEHSDAPLSAVEHRDAGKAPSTDLQASKNANEELVGDQLSVDLATEDNDRVQHGDISAVLQAGTDC